MPICLLNADGTRCEQSNKELKDVGRERYDMCVQNYPYCGDTRLQRVDKMINDHTDRKKNLSNAGRRRSKTKKRSMRRKRMTKRR